VPHILSVRKAEQRSDAVASLTDDNTADGKTGGAENVIAGRIELQVQTTAETAPLPII